jgi:hypothetical protein
LELLCSWTRSVAERFLAETQEDVKAACKGKMYNIKTIDIREYVDCSLARPVCLVLVE